MKLATTLIAVALGFPSATARAHDVGKGPNGGQIVDNAGHHIEMTTKGGQLILFVSDSADKPISSANATGRAIIQDGSKQAAVELIPAEPNVLAATLEGPLAPGVKLVVSIKLGDGHDVKARFVAK
jgi:hypothetical protein